MAGLVRDCGGVGRSHPMRLRRWCGGGGGGGARAQKAANKAKFYDPNVCKFYLQMGESAPWKLMTGTKSEAWVQKAYVKVSRQPMTPHDTP